MKTIKMEAVSIHENSIAFNFLGKCFDCGTKDQNGDIMRTQKQLTIKNFISFCIKAHEGDFIEIKNFYKNNASKFVNGEAGITSDKFMSEKELSIIADTFNLFFADKSTRIFVIASRENGSITCYCRKSQVLNNFKVKFRLAKKVSLLNASLMDAFGNCEKTNKKETSTLDFKINDAFNQNFEITMNGKKATIDTFNKNKIKKFFEVLKNSLENFDSENSLLNFYKDYCSFEQINIELC